MMQSLLSAGRFGDAEVWWIDLASSGTPVEDELVILSPDEQSRARRALSDDVRRRFVKARAGARRLLAGRIGCAPGSLVFHRGTNGKPFLEAGPHFNWSSSGDVTLCALSPTRELGVDVERFRPIPDADALASRYLSPGDAVAIARAPTPERSADAFLVAWTRHEAHAKAAGSGLREEPEAWRVDSLRWKVCELRGPGWVGALVVARKPGSCLDSSLR